MHKIFSSSLVLIALFCLQGTSAWVAPSGISNRARSEPLHALKIGKNYKPKWKKKETLADQEGSADPQEKGITGTINVVFQSGENSISTIANPGTPIRDVATQAGQFIKYGCGKGECGTCAAKCGGQWIKPCIAVIPGDVVPGEDYVIEVKEVKNKAKSSGKFYSFRSFIMGFYNNVLGMFAFVKTRRAARKNYDERMEFEAMVAKRTAEKKAAKEAAEKATESE